MYGSMSFEADDLSHVLHFGIDSLARDKDLISDYCISVQKLNHDDIDKVNCPGQ